MLKIIITIMCVLLAPLSVAFEYTLELTEADIQQKVQAMMPFTKKTLLATVVIEDGQVDLINGSDQLAIAAKIQVNGVAGLTASGRLEIQAGLTYVSAEGAFYLADPKLTNLYIAQLAPALQDNVQQLAQAAMVKALQSYPVYRFKDDDMKQKMAKAMLKSFVIQDEKIILTLGLF